jgi:hypothetical protein
MPREFLIGCATEEDIERLTEVRKAALLPTAGRIGSGGSSRLNRLALP